MKTYIYKAKNTSGEVVNGRINCEDYNEFLTKMNDRSLFVISQREVDDKENKTVKKLKTKDMAFACRQISAMMSAGVTLVKALDILYKQQQKPAQRHIWMSIYEDVQKGKSFSEALRTQPGVFPAYFVSMVAAGESSGSLDVIMDRLSVHYLKEAKMNNKVKGAMIYPIVLLVLCIAVIIGLFIFVLPSFMGMFEGATMPPLTKFMFGLATATKKYWYILLFVVVAIVFGIIYMLKVPSLRLKFDQRLLKFPIIGKLIGKLYIGRFARTLSSLYTSGIPMVESIERSVSILGNSYVSLRFEEVVEDLKKGDPLSTSIMRTEVFDPMFCSIIYVGEEAGALDEILEKISEYYEDEADSAISKMVSLLEPVMIIFLGVVVALIIASILPALYSSMQNIR